MSVKVAVRVRPFNKKELNEGAELCVKMEGQKTTLFDPIIDSKQDFVFDYSFWSHDGFEEIEGYYSPTDDRYADQNKVYTILGQEVLDNAWEGYNCCLFAYGQTGSGKSYSMIGYGENKGIIPRSFQTIFEKISESQTTDLVYEVNVSMLEIYNEKVQDLLVLVSQRPKSGLNVRQHPKSGFFVEGLEKVKVANYAEIEQLMEKGNDNRSVASTQMNATSSRAHTIFQIEFKQVSIVGERKTQKVSVINLVDLAGSEKVGKAGTFGQRLKEGTAINKSLLMLGNVIEALADKASGKKNNAIVNYRDSVLTMILSNALGGNSKTIMICALSPALANYEENLSTLRYADRAKKIKNFAVINETVQDKIIRELKAENLFLKQIVEVAGGKDKILEITEKMKEIEKMKEEQNKRLAFKLPFNIKTDQKLKNSGPYILNVNEDAQLSGKVFYNFDKVPLWVGHKNANPPNDIISSSPSIMIKHCVFDKDSEGNITLAPENEKASKYLLVNGYNVQEAQVLRHLDRIIIGTNMLFVFKIPGSQSELNENDIDYDFIINEKSNQAIEVIEETFKKYQYRKSSKLNAVNILLGSSMIKNILETSISEQAKKQNDDELDEYKKEIQQFMKEEIERLEIENINNERKFIQQRDEIANNYEDQIEKLKAEIEKLRLENEEIKKNKIQNFEANPKNGCMKSCQIF